MGKLFTGSAYKEKLDLIIPRKPVPYHEPANDRGQDHGIQRGVSHFGHLCHEVLEFQWQAPGPPPDCLFLRLHCCVRNSAVLKAEPYPLGSLWDGSGSGLSAHSEPPSRLLMPQQRKEVGNMASLNDM